MIGEWIAAPKTKTYQLDEIPYERTFKGEHVCLFKKGNGQCFICSISIDGLGEPRELQSIGEGKYKYMHRQTDKYFEITPEGNLFYKTGEVTIIKQYINTGQ